MNKANNGADFKQVWLRGYEMELVIRGRKKADKTTKDTGESERELKEFLEGERLPLG